MKDMKEYKRQWRRKHRRRLTQYHRDYAAKNPRDRSNYMRAYWRRHKRHMSCGMKVWRAKNKEHVRELARRRYAQIKADPVVYAKFLAAKNAARRRRREAGR